MPEDKYAQTKNVLRAEINSLQTNYKTLHDYIAGAKHENFEIIGTLQVFKESLSQISAHILTLYVLEGQKTKITWEPLLENITNALETLRTAAHPDPKTAIQLAFNMSEPNAQEVMAYLAKLKESLQ
jgi:hypothetical protein